MTIPATSSEKAYLGNSVTVAFDIPFAFDSVADLKVFATDLVSGAVTPITIGFSVVGTQVIFTSAPGSTTQITILDDPAVTQTTDYVSNDAFPAESHERALDRVTRLVKRLNQKWKRTLRFPDGDIITDGAVTSTVNRRGKYLFFNATTGALEYAVSVIGQTLSQSVIAGFLKPQAQGEIAAGITPVDYSRDYGRLNRYAVNTLPGATDMEGAWQASINSATLSNPKITFSNENSINQPLLITAASIENIVLSGDARTTSILSPLSIDIKRSPQNTNALIINQNDNGHLILEHMRFQSNVAFTGNILYCVEGGCADSSGQALFSSRIVDVWASLSSQNTGLFFGGFSNLKVTDLTVEFANTGVFVFKGVGNGDQLHQNISMDFSYGGYITDTDASAITDTNVKSLIFVNNLNVYEHLRGRVISLNNAQHCKFSNISLEVDPSNIGNTGLFQFTNCQEILCSNCSISKRTGTVQAAVGIELIGNFTGKFENQIINAAIGLSMSGTGTITAEFVNCDFTNCTTCWTMLGTLAGTLKFINCKFNNAQQNCIVQTAGTISFDVDFIGGEILNAGLNGTAGFSNLNITPVGNWIFRGTTFGKNSGGAAAANWVNATAGGGSITFLQPNLISAPPTALNAGTLGVFWDYPKGLATLASAAALTLPYAGDLFTITGTTTVTSMAVAGNVGRKVTLMFQGIVTVTNGASLKLAGATNFVSSADDTLTLYCDGTAWRQTGSSVN